MVLRTIPFIISATLLTYAATAGAGPTNIKAPPDPTLQRYYQKHGPDKWQGSKNPATSPPGALLGVR